MTRKRVVKRSPRDSWRLSAKLVGRGKRLDAEGPRGFDEIVVGDWLHIERMDTGWWWIRLGQDTGKIIVSKDGKAELRWDDGGF